MDRNGSANHASPDASGRRWLPVAAFVFSAGALVATVIVFAIAALPSRDPALMPTTYYIAIWFMFTGLCGLTVAAFILRIRVFRSGARHDAPAWDVFFALAAAVQIKLAMLAAFSSGELRPVLWMLWCLGLAGLLPLAAVRLRLFQR